MLVIHGGGKQTIPEHYRLVQYIPDVDLPVLLLLPCACHHTALLMELTVLPDCLSLDPRGIFVGRSRTVFFFASPGVRNVLFFPPHQQQIITEQMELCQQAPHCLSS